MVEPEYKAENLANAQALGIDMQILQAIEEMAELTQALSKASRYWLHAKNRNDSKVQEVLDNVTEEVADVEIMLEQMKYFFNIQEEKLDEIKRYKIRRSTNRRNGIPGNPE